MRLLGVPVGPDITDINPEQWKVTEPYPAYMQLYESGELARRAEAAWELLRACTVCPQNCKVNRLAGKTGACHSGTEAIVGSWNVHRREEPPISGTGGAGTIFFGYCQARCTYCQNFWLSQDGKGHRVGPERLADMMLYLQKKGCHNIDLVTPTHFVPQILQALLVAIPKGFRLPFVYNSAGYEFLHVLRLLDGVIDIYMPDAKYSDNTWALKTSKMHHYVDFNRAALKEMYRQVGPLQVDEDGIGTRGLLIRHLVMPNDISGTSEVLRWIATELGPEVPVSLMDQYFPAWKAHDDPNLNRRLHWREYRAAVEVLEELGLDAGFVQEDLAALDESSDL
ncbi:MAG TPA: radical SAM protein [Ktedonobacterales bacterium]|nr:radical SAM protein [Ktedonobacterales bacterium]